jgi:hypothetical protein
LSAFTNEFSITASATPSATRTATLRMGRRSSPFFSWPSATVAYVVRAGKLI